jgi:phosphoserine phosphatase RsbU/P
MVRRSQTVVVREHRRDKLRRRREQDQRVLASLYTISLACRDRPALRTILETIYHELSRIFSFDAVYVALCDQVPGTFRAALLVDEGQEEYIEGLEYGPLTSIIVRTRVPLLYHDLLNEGDPHAPGDMFGNVEKFSRAWLGVPLMVGVDVVGVISIQSYRVGIYTPATQDLLQRIANVIAVVVENVRLIEVQGQLSQALAVQVTARTEEIDAFSRIASAVVTRRPLPMILDQALDVTLTLFRFDAGTVRLLDDSHQNLVLQAHRGLAPQYAEVTFNSPLQTSPLRLVVIEGRPLVIERGWYTRFDPNHFPVHVFPPFECALSVPLSIGTNVLGTLTLFALHSRTFSAYEVRLAQSVANQIAVVVENARLLEERERKINELRALSSVSRAASTAQDVRTLLHQVHNALKDFIPLDTFSMLIYDPDRRVVSDAISIEGGYTYAYWSGQPPPPRSLSAWIIRSGMPLRFENLPEQIAVLEDVDRSTVGSVRQPLSWLGVPMIDRDGRVIGVISVQSDSPGTFSIRDERLLHNVAAQVALHVQNVRLLTQRARQISELEAIGQIGKLVTASYDLDLMLDEVRRVVVDATDASVFYLLICQPGSRTVTHAIFVEGGVHVSRDMVGVTIHEGTLSDWILINREPLLYHDLPAQRDDLTRRGITPRPVGPHNEVRSWAGVPLVARDGDMIGVLSVQDYRPHHYDISMIDFLEQVGSHVSLGVQKVRLFEAVEAQSTENVRLAQEARAHATAADTLREVARVLSSSFNPDEVLRLILGELHKVIAYDTASIMLLDGDQLRMVASRGRPGGDNIRGISLSLEGSAAGDVVRRREPLLWQIERSEGTWMRIPTSTNIRAWIGTPLIARGNMLGVLNIDIRNGSTASFSERDIDVARTFANHAAVALENAQLYQESITRIEQELEIARRIQSNLFPRHLPRVGGLSMAARCLPARETGGDFYDVVDLGSRIGVIVGDVSGKSLPAAMLMAVARSTSRSEARNHETPWVVLTETNRWLVDDVPKNAFVALSYAVVDPQQCRMTLANGGHLSPLLRHADGSTSFITAPAALPLGVWLDTEYGQVEIDLAIGDTILFYTDGIIEAHDQGRNLFGFDRLEALLVRWGHLPPDDLIALILIEVARFSEGTFTHDDMTLMAIRVG